MSYIDSHCHLHMDPLRADADGAIARAVAQGVSHMLCVSVGLDDAPVIGALAARHTNIFGSVGVHPNELAATPTLYDDLVRLSAHERIVAIGETGLDYYRLSGPRDIQQDQFRQHIAAARRTGKPLIVHTREAADDTIRLLQEEGAGEVGGVLHCFTGSAEMARAALDLNFYISFSGIVTFRNADALRKVAGLIPADRLLIETDAPYLAPVPYRGTTNEPAYVRWVAESLAEVRGVAVEVLADCTSNNFFRLFGATA